MGLQPFQKEAIGNFILVWLRAGAQESYASVFGI